MRGYDLEQDPIHYVGMSEIKDEKVYFEVSTNIIPTDDTSYVFADEFLKRLGFDKEMDIEEDSLKKLKEVVKMKKQSRITHITPQFAKNGNKRFKLWNETGRNYKLK